MPQPCKEGTEKYFFLHWQDDGTKSILLASLTSRISKIMVNSLKPIINCIISEEQSALVAGRQIHDNIVVAQETFSYLRPS